MKNITIELTSEQAKSLATLMNYITGVLQYKAATEKDPVKQKHLESKWSNAHTISKAVQKDMNITFMDTETHGDLIITRV